MSKCAIYLISAFLSTALASDAAWSQNATPPDTGTDQNSPSGAPDLSSNRQGNSATDTTGSTSQNGQNKSDKRDKFDKTNSSSAATTKTDESGRCLANDKTCTPAQ